jgi:hypothetical protein
MKNLGQYNSAIRAGIVILVTLFITQIMLVKLSPHIHDGQRLYEYFVIGLFSTIGVTVGWFLGVITSPDPDQSRKFAMTGSAVATFFSGFLVSKLNDGWDKILKSGTENSVLIMRISFALAWFLVAFTMTFLTRSFYPSQDGKVSSVTGNVPSVGEAGISPAWLKKLFGPLVRWLRRLVRL